MSKKNREDTPEPEELIAPVKQPVVIMSHEAIESRYQAHLEKIRTGGK